MASKSKKVRTITEVVGDATETKLPRIPKIVACNIWGKEEAAKIREDLTVLGDSLGANHYRRLGEALADRNARELQGEQKFLEAEAVLADTVEKAEEGRIREILTLDCGRSMLQFFPKSPLGLLHFGNHGKQIGLFRQPKPGEKALTIELPIGIASRWEWTTLLSPIPGGNDIIGSLRPFADGVREKLRREEEKMAVHRLETLKGKMNFASVMKAGTGRTVCHVPALRQAPECWLELGLGNNQIRVLCVSGGNEFQRTLANLAIPLGSIETRRFTYNVRELMGPENLRRAEYLLACLLDGLKQKPGTPRPAPQAAPAIAPAPVIALLTAPEPPPAAPAEITHTVTDAEKK